jgi:16S rRNA (cytosine1402-N4)-methyltransferase
MAYRPRHRRPRSTPQGQHRPVQLAETLRVLDPRPGGVFVDATVGWAGHSAAILPMLGPTGMLVGFDLDAENLTKARERLDLLALPYRLEHGNFAGVQAALAASGILAVDGLIADLGFSSMQVDDPARGFSYRREGPLDMRLDRSRGRTAAQILATIDEHELARHLRELADEPFADKIARAVVLARDAPPATTTELATLIQAATGQADWKLHPKDGVWKIHPAARTFQALRILVNRELANLENLLRVLPAILKPGAAAAILSFHSGEDRIVKAAFRDGLHRGDYSEVSDDPVRATTQERFSNPRSRSAKLRWARRAPNGP